MTSDLVRRAPSLGEAVRRSWAWCLAILLVGLLAGVAISLSVPVKYTAQAKLIAGATNVNITAVPAFAEAGKSLAESYSRIFLGDQTRKVLSDQVGAPVGVQDDGHLSWRGPSGRLITVGASPIAGSSIILIEASGDSPASAVRAADDSSRALTATVIGLLTNGDGQQKAEASLKVALRNQADAQARIRAGSADPVDDADLRTAQTEVNALTTQLNEALAASNAGNGVQPLASASVTSNTALQRFGLWGAVGLVVGAVVAAAFAWLRLALREPWQRRRAARRARRLARKEGRNAQKRRRAEAAGGVTTEAGPDATEAGEPLPGATGASSDVLSTHVVDQEPGEAGTDEPAHEWDRSDEDAASLENGSGIGWPEVRR